MAEPLCHLQKYMTKVSSWTPSSHSRLTYTTKNTTKSTFFHLKNISGQPSLSNTVIETLICAMEACMVCLARVSLDRLQYVQNSANPTKLWQHITPVLKQLHWITVKSCITYKILLLTFKSLHALAPQYLLNFLHTYSQSRSLWSSSKDQLAIPIPDYEP